MPQWLSNGIKENEDEKIYFRHGAVCKEHAVSRDGDLIDIGGGAADNVGA